MIYKWLKNNALIAGSLLLVFVTAMTSSALCDLGYIEYGSKHVHEVVTEGQSHDHHKDVDHHHVTNKVEIAHDKDTNHIDQSEECCDDISASLLASFQMPVDFQRVDAASYFLIHEITSYIMDGAATTVLENPHYKYNTPPPLRVREIIVKMQTFLI